MKESAPEETQILMTYNVGTLNVKFVRSGVFGYREVWKCDFSRPLRDGESAAIAEVINHQTKRHIPFQIVFGELERSDAAVLNRVAPLVRGYSLRDSIGVAYLQGDNFGDVVQ